MTSAFTGVFACALALFFVFPAAGAVFLGTQQFLLEIWVNGQSRNIVAAVAERDGALWAKAADLAAAGVKVPAANIATDGFVDLTSLRGVAARLVGDEQKLALTVEQSLLVPQVFDLLPHTDVLPASSGTGFIAEYDVAASIDDFGHAGGTSSLGARMAGTFFTPLGSLTGSGFTVVQPRGSRLARLDTAAAFDEQETMRRWVAGDAISGGLGWSRSVRFAGLQLATDFSLRPDLLTMPLPSFFGQTAVPATVDVFINSAQAFETHVDAGPFKIDNLPIVTGRGDASVVIRDVLGREVTTLLPFFGNAAQLRRGLSSYDLDVGVLRKAYGLKSFAYGVPMLAGTYRYGATDGLTLETHGEATANLFLGGLGAVLSLGPYGGVQLGMAGSHAKSFGRLRNGLLYFLAVDTQFPPLGLFAAITGTSGAYTDLAALESFSPPRRQLQVGANLNLWNSGSLAVSWIERKSDRRDTTRLMSASYTLPLADRWYAGASGFYDQGSGVWTVEAFLSISFAGDITAHVGSRSGSHLNEEEIGITKSVNPDGGFGYRLSASTGDNDIEEADATWIGPHGRLDAGLSSVNGTEAGRVGASGALVAMSGSLYASQVPGGAVALVRTGEKDIRIFRENRPVATADADGEALLTSLVPYSANRISVVPDDYRFSTIVDTTDKFVVPRRMAAVVVDLAPTSHNPALAILRLQSGAPPPAGSHVILEGGEDPLVVGRGGEVFIADFIHAVKGRVEYNKGSCRFEGPLPAASSADVIARIGPFLCVEDAR